MLRVSDRTFLLHLGGKIEMNAKSPLKTRDDLSMAYTPGVARVSQAIAADPAKAWTLTIKHNAVAVVSDGTAVLGLGDIGPEAAMPVMEGKALLFKEFGGIDAWPICLATKDPTRSSRSSPAIAPGFDGINLEDISAPRCFEIEERLRRRARHPGLPRRPARHRRRRARGTAERAQVVGKGLEDLHVVLTGVGAAGTATTRMLLAAGVHDVIGCDRDGALAPRRRDLTPRRPPTPSHEPLRPRRHRRRAPRGRRRLHRPLRPGAVSPEAVRSMADDAIVFAMANPTPEVAPELIEAPSPSSRRVAPTTRTRSTTCSPSPGSSAARSTFARPRSRRR